MWVDFVGDVQTETILLVDFVDGDGKEMEKHSKKIEICGSVGGVDRDKTERKRCRSSCVAMRVKRGRGGGGGIHSKNTWQHQIP